MYKILEGVFTIKTDYALIAVLLIALVFINSCGKAECKADSECLPKPGSRVSCVEKQCKYSLMPNFCGNGKKEAIENGKQGNECTCPEDYGVCAGRLKIGEGKRAVDSKFLQRYCEEERCIVGVPEEEVREVTLLDERDFGIFKLETAVTYNEPFDVAKDSFYFRINVKDDSEDIVFPIKLDKAIINDGEVLFGEKKTELLLQGVKDTVSFEIPVFYELEKPEEARRLAYKVSYEYKKRVKDQRLEDGSYSYKNETVREDYQNRFSTKINLVNSLRGFT